MTNETPIATAYRGFADQQAHGVSATYEDWALGVAEDPAVQQLLATLPRADQQPNLVFAAARWTSPGLRTYADLRRTLLDRWGEVAEVVATRSTQTNEVARCALLLPVLAQIPGPLALVEVGASAGLCLHPDRYSYRYSNGDRVDPATGPSPVVLRCQATGDPPIPQVMPDVVWRAGVDLNPLDVQDAEAVRWLEHLIWPEHEHRRVRLAAAVELTRHSPARIVRGDLNDVLPSLVTEVPDGVTPVVFHSAVLAYLDPPDRKRFVATVSGLPGHWISNEGRTVVPFALPHHPTSDPGTSFVVALDGQPLALASGHGDRLEWLEPV